MNFSLNKTRNAVIIIISVAVVVAIVLSESCSHYDCHSLSSPWLGSSRQQALRRKLICKMGKIETANSSMNKKRNE